MLDAKQQNVFIREQDIEICIFGSYHEALLVFFSL